MLSFKSFIWKVPKKKKTHESSSHGWGKKKKSSTAALSRQQLGMCHKRRRADQWTSFLVVIFYYKPFNCCISEWWRRVSAGGRLSSVKWMNEWRISCFEYWLGKKKKKKEYDGFIQDVSPCPAFSQCRLLLSQGLSRCTLTFLITSWFACQRFWFQCNSMETMHMKVS